MNSTNSPVPVFIAYSRKDNVFLDELRTHLIPLERNGKIEVWTDRQVAPGHLWEDSIKAALHRAQIVLLLVSADSIASDYFSGEEMRISLDRHYRRETTVVPVILRPCAWKETPLGAIQALPLDGKPIVAWPSRDEAWENVAVVIGNLVRKTGQRAAPTLQTTKAAPVKKQGREPDLPTLRLSAFTKRALLAMTVVCLVIWILQHTCSAGLFKKEDAYADSGHTPDTLAQDTLKKTRSDKAVVQTPTSQPARQSQAPIVKRDTMQAAKPDTIVRPLSEAEKRAQTEEEARKVAAEEANRRAASAFARPGTRNPDQPGIGSGGGPGNTNPFAATGVTTTSSIHGGFTRGIVSRPVLNDYSQQTGKVAIDLCVDASGHVVSAEYAKTKSTTDNNELRNKALTWARQFRFAPSTATKECGTITFNFQVK